MIAPCLADTRDAADAADAPGPLGTDSQAAVTTPPLRLEATTPRARLEDTIPQSRLHVMKSAIEASGRLARAQPVHSNELVFGRQPTEAACSCVPQ